MYRAKALVGKALLGVALLLGVGAGSAGIARAQGFDVQPWPSRKALPPLEGTDLAGNVWKLSDLRGRAVLINFWASWCEPCRAEMPALEALAAQHGPQRLLVLAVNYKEPAPTVQRFVQRTALALPVLLDPAGDSARAWGITIYPSTVLVDARGEVRGLVRGALDWAGAPGAALVQPLLAATP